MNLYLLIHNIGFILSAFATITALFFLVLNNPRAKGHITLALAFLFVTIYIASHILGVNTTDPEISRKILMFNLSIILIGMFNVHAFLSLLNKDGERKYVIIFIYTLGLGLILWFIRYPDFFLLSSTPKMYFPNYYVPGEYNWLRVAYLFGLCFPYMLFELLDSYKKTLNVYKKKQLKYLIIGFIIAYVFSFVPNFLVYDIQFDPLYGMAFMVFFAIIFLYGAIRYELMNIKVIAKQASIYSLIIGSIGGSIILIQYINQYITSSYTNFPLWIVPSISIILVMFITLIVWKKIREVDLLKYEFITTVTHKFRTPLTQIKWSVDNLKHKDFDEEDKKQVNTIESAIKNLVELTNVLVSISEADDVTYGYHFKKINIRTLIDEVVDSVKDLALNKKIIIKNQINEDIFVPCDDSRMKFVIQTFLENALHYTPINGNVIISANEKNNRAEISVKDTGIGIEEDEQSFMFSKFYRGNKARSLDTEGMGIGLFISKDIIQRHNGKIWVESEGLNKGSTFYFSLPLAK